MQVDILPFPIPFVEEFFSFALRSRVALGRIDLGEDAGRSLQDARQQSGFESRLECALREPVLSNTDCE